MGKVPQRILAIIPARGGSKGIPRKNLIEVAGRPLLAHSIVQAKQTPSINRILVSTDDVNIADVAREWGAEVVARPSDISGDRASSESALIHALDWLQTAENYEPDLVVFLQATSPCRQPGEIQLALDRFSREDADSLLSVGPVHGFVWRMERDGNLRSFTYDHLHRPRRQDAPEDLIENGSFYIFKPWVLREHNNRLGGKVSVHRMSALDSFQIDEPGDFELLETLMRHRGLVGSTAEAVGIGAESHGANRSVEGVQQGIVFDRGDRPTPSNLAEIGMLVLDFDGVLTDNRVLVSEDGTESVLCSRSDGMGLAALRAEGVEILVLSKEKNPVVNARCRKLQLECIQGCDEKLGALQEIATRRGLTPRTIAYVGNDVNDLQCLRWVGTAIAVSDAVPEVKAVAAWITTKLGGGGAVREVCDAILVARRVMLSSGPATT